MHNEDQAVERALQQVLEQAAGGLAADQLVPAILQTLAAQSTALRVLERAVDDLRGHREGTSERRAPPTLERRRSGTDDAPMVVKGKRWSDQCQFCGKRALEVEAMFSSPTGANICTSCIDMLNALRT